MKTKTVYQTVDGVYVGETIAHESPLEPGVFLIPSGCVETSPPEIADGKRAVWRDKWIVENIPALQGEANSEPTAEEIEARRVAEIKGQMAALDFKSIRPLRAIASGKATQADKDSLVKIEAEASVIRAKL